MKDRSGTFRIAVRAFGPFETAIAQAWDAFARGHPDAPMLNAVPLDLHPLYDTLIANRGLEDGSWDVAFLSSDWFAAVHERGAVVDLGPGVAADPPADFPDGWSPSLRGLQQFGETIIGLPYHDGPECLMYRSDLFTDPARGAAFASRFGRPLAPPRTWAEFHDIARHFQRPAEGLFGTAFAGYPDGHNTVYDFFLQLWSRGGELFDSEGGLHIETPAAIAALEFYRRILKDDGAVHPASRELDSVAAGAAFARGEIAMMVNWFGFAAVAAASPESAVHGAVDIAPIPSDAGNGVSLNAYWILAIGAGSRHRDLAWAFLRFCAEADQDRRLTELGGIGCRRSTWTDPAINAGIPFYHRLEAIHATARELPRRADWARVSAIIDDLVLTTMNSDAPIPQILAQTAARFQAELRSLSG